MPYYKIAYNKQQEVYYPRAVVQGKPVETETIAKDLAKISTVSNSDVQAVLGDIAGVMHTRMAAGKSVHITGLGYFRYALTAKGRITASGVLYSPRLVTTMKKGIIPPLTYMVTVIRMETGRLRTNFSLESG